MKIQTRLKLHSVVSLFFVMLTILTIFLSALHLKKTASMDEAAFLLVKGVAELETLAYDYMLHHEHRGVRQWKIKYKSVMRLLETDGLKTDGTENIVSQIYSNLEKIDDTFIRLVSTYEDTSKNLSDKQLSIQRALEERLVVRISLESREIVARSFKLDMQVHSRLQDIGLWTFSIILFLSFFLFIIIFFGSRALMTAIARPITELEKGVGRIGSGDLDYKVGIAQADEIGALSRSFDKMTENLKIITASRDELDQEILVREGVEEELKNTSQVLKERVRELDCLFCLSDIIEKNKDSLRLIMEETVLMLPQYLHYPDEVGVRIVYRGKEFENMVAEAAVPALSRDIFCGTEKVGCLEVFYAGDPGHRSDGYFYQEERTLLDALAERLGQAVEKISAQENAKYLQEQLIRSERLAAVGQLAASVAHEINSPLQAVTTTIHNMQKLSTNDANMLDRLTLLSEAIRRIGSTVKNLLDLNRPMSAEKQLTDINELIQKIIKLFQAQLKENSITLQTLLSPEQMTVMASPQLLTQVFINLLNNAIEAFAKATSHSVSEEKTAAKKILSISTEKTTKEIIITFSDNGPGIDIDDIKNVFSPYFTKKKTMGLGVGLSICQNIIVEHHGRIDVKNRPEGGAVFTISLPAE